MFSRILIANRGEIALRIIRACKELGIETVAVYSEADRRRQLPAPGRRARSASARRPAAESYLNIPRIIAAAEIADVEAIHPGYGFLAENAHFAEICRDCKIEFIGPSVESDAALGDKIEAKELAKAAKVPIAPGSDGAVDADEEAVAVAEQIGYPVAHQGRRRRRRAGHPVRPQRGHAPAPCFKQAQSRGGDRLRRRPALHGEVHRERPPHRGPDPRRPARQRGAPASSATAPSSGGARS